MKVSFLLKLKNERSFSFMHSYEDDDKKYCTIYKFQIDVSLLNLNLPQMFLSVKRNVTKAKKILKKSALKFN